MSVEYTQLGLALLPEAILTGGALVVLLVDLVMFRNSTRQDRLLAASALGVVSCIAATLLLFAIGNLGSVFGGVFAIDPLSVLTRFGVYALTILALGIGTGGSARAHPAEYVAVVLFSAIGLSVMASAQQFLLAFVGLELASLSLYVLVGFDKSRPESAEAGLKYFLVGGTSAAFLLFGISLIYGVTGSLMFGEISGTLLVAGQDPIVAVALIMVLVAFGYKAAAAPFHLWAPDAYQGAPTTSAAFVASASKLAGFVLFTRLLWTGMIDVAGRADYFDGAPGWLPVVAVLGAVSIVLGNVVALAQSNVRRLLAYSAIAHAGALIIGVMIAGEAGPAPLFYYAATYGVATVGAFGVIAVLERSGEVQKLSDLVGLRRRSPFLTACLFVFVLSLAGIPPLAGFFGKFYVFAAAFQTGGFSGPVGWLAALAIVFSAVGFYYYLMILKQAFVIEKSGEELAPVRVSFAAGAALLIAVVIVIGLGVWPSVLLERFQ